MQHPLRVTFHDMRHSDAIEAAVREHADKLERFYERIQSCHVTIEPWSRRHHSGNLYTVRIDLTVPGKELAVGNDHTPHHAHEDVYVAVRLAFDEMRRLLQDHARTQRGYVKGGAVAETVEEPVAPPAPRAPAGRSR